MFRRSCWKVLMFSWIAFSFRVVLVGILCHVCSGVGCVTLALRVRVVRSNLRHLVLLASSSHWGWNWCLSLYVLVGRVVGRHCRGAARGRMLFRQRRNFVNDISRRNAFSQCGGFALLFCAVCVE